LGVPSCQADVPQEGDAGGKALLADSATLLGIFAGARRVDGHSLQGAHIPAILNNIAEKNSSRVAKSPVASTGGSRIPETQQRGDAQDTGTQTGVQPCHVQSEKNIHALTADQGEWVLTDIAH
jgi:hypothetical protein